MAFELTRGKLLWVLQKELLLSEPHHVLVKAPANNGGQDPVDIIHFSAEFCLKCFSKDILENSMGTA